MGNNKLKITKQEAKEVQASLESYVEYIDLIANMPWLKAAVDALPDTHLLCSRCNIIERSLVLDAICRVRGVPDGSLDKYNQQPPAPRPRWKSYH